MHEKTGHDNKGMSGHGFTFPVGGSVPVIFISMVLTTFRNQIFCNFTNFNKFFYTGIYFFCL
jgi:hypothetical protein